MKLVVKLLTAAALLPLAAACNSEAGGGNAAVASNEPITPIAAPNGGDWTQTIAQTPEGGILMGNPNAPVKLVEFASMTCPHCATFSQEGEKELIEEYVKSGRVSFEFRNFVRDPLDITASLLIRCGDPKNFFKLTGQAFEQQRGFFDRLQAAPPAEMQALQSQPPAQQFQAMARLSGLQEWAAQRGVPSGKAGQCLSDQGAIDRLVQMQADAISQYNVPGTPSFVINGALVENAADWGALEPKLREALRS